MRFYSLIAKIYIYIYIIYMGYPLPIPGQFQLQQAEVPWRHLFSQPTKLTVKTLELELRLRPQRLAGPDDG